MAEVIEDTLQARLAAARERFELAVLAWDDADKALDAALQERTAAAKAFGDLLREAKTHTRTGDTQTDGSEG